MDEGSSAVPVVEGGQRRATAMSQGHSHPLARVNEARFMVRMRHDWDFPTTWRSDGPKGYPDASAVARWFKGGGKSVDGCAPMAVSFSGACRG